MAYFILCIKVAQPSTTVHQPQDEEQGDEDTEKRKNRVEYAHAGHRDGLPFEIGPQQLARMDQICECWHLLHSPSKAHSGEIWTITRIEGGNCDALGTIRVVVAEPVIRRGTPTGWLFPALLPSEWGQVEIVVRPVEQIDPARGRRVRVKDVLALAQEDTQPTLPRRRPSWHGSRS